MYCQIIEELKSDKIFEPILFDIIASLSNFRYELQQRQELALFDRPNVLDYFNHKFSHIFTMSENLKINQNYIFNDSQNVHEFVHSTMKIAKAIMKKYPARYERPLSLNRVGGVFFDVIENATINGIKACDVFASIYYYIINHKHKEEMIKRLIEEIHESRNTCASGHITRMINSIRGFQNDFCTKLDEYESTKAIMFHKINKEINAYDLFSLNDFEFLINSGKITFTSDLQTTLRILKDYSKIDWFVEQNINELNESVVVFKPLNKFNQNL
jgi:hypothetical protein